MCCLEKGLGLVMDHTQGKKVLAELFARIILSKSVLYSRTTLIFSANITNKFAFLHRFITFSYYNETCV